MTSAGDARSARYTYQRLVELVDDDHELIDELVEHGVIEERGGDRVLVDIDSVLAARTLRELEIDWSGIATILHLRDELIAARRRIAELETALADRRS